MGEHYTEDVLQRTRRLYEDVRGWARSRDDVSIIGGWLVYEHVEPGHAQQSRDVDIALHSEAALKDVLHRMPGWGLVLRKSGRKTFPDAHFPDEGPLAFRLDLFTTKANPTWDWVFGRHGFHHIKEVPNRFLPDLEWIIEDKLRTVVKRQGRNAGDKRAKDLMDIHNLVFHNRQGELAQDLAKALYGRAKVISCLPDARRQRPEYREPFALLERWLES